MAFYDWNLDLALEAKSRKQYWGMTTDIFEPRLITWVIGKIKLDDGRWRIYRSISDLIFSDDDIKAIKTELINWANANDLKVSHDEWYCAGTKKKQSKNYTTVQIDDFFGTTVISVELRKQLHRVTYEKWTDVTLKQMTDIFGKDVTTWLLEEEFQIFQSLRPKMGTRNDVVVADWINIPKIELSYEKMDRSGPPLQLEALSSTKNYKKWLAWYEKYAKLKQTSATDALKKKRKRVSAPFSRKKGRRSSNSVKTTKTSTKSRPAKSSRKSTRKRRVVVRLTY